eukprot:9145072-Pyramimonas_sp.AAC.1
MAETAARAALESPVGFAWELLTKAWQSFSNCLELELESFLGVPIKDKGLKGVTHKAVWVPIFSTPKSACTELVNHGWVWSSQH